MEYARPEIVLLGDATRIIELINPKSGPVNEWAGPPPHSALAYDLDE
jgi:hypothetical protein